MRQPTPKEIAEWHWRASRCPCTPTCRPLKDCPIAVPLESSLWEKGSGGSDPTSRSISFVQTHTPHDQGEYIERLYGEALDTFGSLSVADHPTAVTWRRFGQAANALPLNYKGRRALIALAETGFVTKAAKAAGISRHQLDPILRRFCAEYGIDRRHLLRTSEPRQSSRRQGKEYKGVTWHKQRGRWWARISVNGAVRSLGLFASAIEAAKAYDRAAVEAFGSSAVINFPTADQRAA